jgi:NAD(P)-dependent dehydrogenase (short-subunit alcohol dehydrogenase family)
MPPTNEEDKANKRAIPLRCYGTPDDIGQAAVFLASPLAQYITGTVLSVDGGLNLIGSALWNQHVESMPLRSKN